MEDAALLGPTGPGSHSSAPPSPSRWPECPRSISLSASQRLEFAALDTTGMERNCWRFLFVRNFSLYLGKGICLKLVSRIKRNVKNCNPALSNIEMDIQFTALNFNCKLINQIILMP